jgi:uncharacterized membrane protein YkoI
MKSEKRTATLLLIMAATILVGTASNITYIQKAGAQMSGGGSNMTAGGAGGMMMMGNPGVNITGSVPIFPTIANAIASQVHVSLSNATTTAEKNVSSNAHGVAARLGVQNGFLVYTIEVIDPSNNFHRVIVDVGNGKVLSSQQLSMREMMRGGMGMGMMGHPGMGMMMGSQGMGMMGSPNMMGNSYP